MPHTYSLEQTDDSMPLNEQDRAWIRETIQTAQRTQNRGVFLRLLKEWGGIGAAVAVSLFFVAQYTTYVEFRTKTTSTLEGIGKRLDGIDTKLTQQTLASIAGSPLDIFKTSLPQLKSSVALARTQTVKIPDDVLGDIDQKLMATDSNTPHYWPVVAELINYRSVSVSPWEQSKSELPNCVDLPFTPQVRVDSATQMTMLPYVFTNCQFTLDSELDQTVFNEHVKSGTPIVFRHCVIKYHGGTILLTESVHAKNVPLDSYPPPGSNREAIHAKVNINGDNLLRFIDCHFSFILDNPPKQPNFAKLLLIAGESADIPISSAAIS